MLNWSHQPGYIKCSAREGADSGRSQCNAHASRGFSFRIVRKTFFFSRRRTVGGCRKPTALSCGMSAFALSNTWWRRARCRSSQSHYCRNVEGGRLDRGVFRRSHGRLRSTRSRGRPPERAGNRHHAPAVLMESPSSTIHYTSSSYLPSSTLLSTTYTAGL